MNLGVFEPFLPLKNELPNKYFSPSQRAADSFYVSSARVKILVQGDTPPASGMVTHVGFGEGGSFEQKLSLDPK